MEDIWQRSLNAYRQRLDQLQKGLALAEGVEDIAEFESLKASPETELTEEVLELGAHCKWCAYANLCGSRD